MTTLRRGMVILHALDQALKLVFALTYTSHGYKLRFFEELEP